MSRIRSIKPEFWTSAQVMECSPITRLFFIGLWNFCDDYGRHPVSEKQLKALIFPGDDVPVSNIRGMINELAANDLVEIYVVDGKQYLSVSGWKHQKIDRPQPSKSPAPPSTIRRPFDDHSTNSIDGREGKGEEGKNRDASASLVDGEPPTPDAPVASQPELPLADPIKLDLERNRIAEARSRMREVAEAWNELAGSLHLPQIEEIKAGSAREKAALARIREGADFDRVFARIRGSPFLRGDKGHTPAAFDWIMNPTNLTKILEGNYEDRKAKR